MVNSRTTTISDGWSNEPSSGKGSVELVRPFLAAPLQIPLTTPSHCADPALDDVESLAVTDRDFERVAFVAEGQFGRVRFPSRRVACP